MEITLLVKSVIGLVIVLAILIFLLLYSTTPKKKETVKKETKNLDAKDKNQKVDLDSLRAIIKNKKSNAKELSDALDLVIKHYGVIPKKLGTRIHPDFDKYMDILFTICRHPNTNKNLIIKFDKELIRLNPEYKAEINNAVTKGLNSRGA